MTAKAPVGGIVSHVNGQFYDGGQFLPDHGKFCGKGKNRVALAEFDSIAELARTKGYTLAYREQFDNFALSLPSGLIMHTAKSLKTLAIFVQDRKPQTVNVNPI